MRVGIFFSITLAAHTAVASRCQPRSSISPISASAESVTLTTASASTDTSAEAQTTTSGLTPTTTSIATSDVATTTTVSTDSSTSAVALTSESGTTTQSMTTYTSSQTDTTTSAVSISTTTTSTTTTSDPAFQPIATFGLQASGSQVNTQYLTGRDIPGYMTGWNLEGGGTVPLSFSIDPITKYARESNGYYWCVVYGNDGQRNFLELCYLSALRDQFRAFLTCDQKATGKLECSVPAAQCGIDQHGLMVCRHSAGLFTEFYTYSGRSDGIFITISSASNPPTASTFQPVELLYTSPQS